MANLKDSYILHFCLHGVLPRVCIRCTGSDMMGIELPITHFPLRHVGATDNWFIDTEGESCTGL